MPNAFRNEEHEPQKALLDWFFRNRRDLPWRTAPGVPRDPWGTLVSEVMSQQTRLEVVVPRFRAWMDRYPTPEALAETDEDEVLAAWAGLGYYSRARNLRKAAIAIADAGWSRTYPDLLELPGLGPYTAAAVASLCFGEQVPMVDGNVVRVLSRFHAFPGDAKTGTGAKEFARLSREWIVNADAGGVNEATMELGALVCTPRSPACGNCPIASGCRACALGEPEGFPFRAKRAERLREESVVAVVETERGVLLRQAGPGELLSGLWILPKEGDDPGLYVSGPSLGRVRHSITNHDIRWDVRRGTWKGTAVPPGWEWCPLASLRRRIVSSLPRKALEAAGIAIRRHG